MEAEYTVERGIHTGRNRAYRHIPRHKTMSEKGSGKIRCGQVDERGGKEHHLDKEKGHQLFCDCVGTEICICGRLPDASGRGKPRLC
eukprot:3258214-Heterocapsa_arctica.AAC.1